MGVSGKTKVYGLIGDPVSHSLSPLLHNSLAGQMGHDLIYVAFPVARPAFVEFDKSWDMVEKPAFDKFDKGGDMVEKAILGAYELGICGLNVTTPHKEAVIPHLKALDPAAAIIGAVNTLLRTKGGYVGHNTDYTGLYRAMASEQMMVGGAQIAILGAGATARSAAYMCHVYGAARVFIINRGREKARTLAAEMNQLGGNERFFAVAADDITRLPTNGLLAIQCTSLGMGAKCDEALLTDPAFYERVTAGMDMIYHPVETAFMRMLRKAGGRAHNGLKMLLYQGVDAYDIWQDTKVPDAYINHTYDRLRAAAGPNIILVGFMGSGKSTVAAGLSAQSGRRWIDTDEWIEERQGMSVAEIFATRGEAHFRKLETLCLENLLESAQQGLIIATGGGMVLSMENRRMLKQLGRVVYLKASVDRIRERTRKSADRPLLSDTDMDPKQKIQALLKKREALYQEAANYSINTDDLTPEQIAEEILEDTT